MTESVPCVASDWNARLCRAFNGIFIVEMTHRGRQTVIQARSRDERAFWETVAEHGVLSRARLRLALPARDDLENVSLGCWTLLFLKAVLPEWVQLETWIQECGARAAVESNPIETRLSGYTVACRLVRHPLLLEYRLVQTA
jgi:hypothetical protein